MTRAAIKEAALQALKLQSTEQLIKSIDALIAACDQDETLDMRGALFVVDQILGRTDVYEIEAVEAQFAQSLARLTQLAADSQKATHAAEGQILSHSQAREKPMPVNKVAGNSPSIASGTAMPGNERGTGMPHTEQSKATCEALNSFSCAQRSTKRVKFTTFCRLGINN